MIAGCVLIFLGFMVLPNLLLSVPALVVGFAICCSSNSVDDLKRQMGCVKCWAITGVVTAIGGLFIVIIAGWAVLSSTHIACEAAAYNTTYHSSTSPCGDTVGRMLAEGGRTGMTAHGASWSVGGASGKPAPSAYEIVHAHMPGLWPALEASAASRLAAALSVPELYRIEHGAERRVRDVHRRQLTHADCTVYATVRNDDSCNAASDGDCDDGGPGAEYAVCALGTDVSDCGCTSPMSTDAPPPNDDSCVGTDLYGSSWVSDGMCDDGGPGAEFDACHLGSDVSDCGNRSSSAASFTWTPDCDELRGAISDVCDLHGSSVVVVVGAGLLTTLFIAAFSCVLCKAGSIEAAPSRPPMNVAVRAQHGQPVINALPVRPVAVPIAGAHPVAVAVPVPVQSLPVMGSPIAQVEMSKV